MTRSPICLLVSLGLSLLAPLGQAATYTVDAGTVVTSTNFDTLNAAIVAANANAGADTITIVDSATYAEDLTTVTESVAIIAASGQTPTIQKSASASGNRSALQFVPASTNGTLTIQGASEANRLTITRSDENRALVNLGNAVHGNLVLSNVILSAPTTGASAGGAMLNLNQTSDVLQTTVLTNVRFVGGENTSDAFGSASRFNAGGTGRQTIVATGLDFTLALGVSPRVITNGPADSLIQISDSNFQWLNIPTTPVTGFNITFRGSARVELDNCDFSGGPTGNNFTNPVASNGTATAVIRNCNLRTNAQGQRLVTYDGAGTSITIENCDLRAPAGTFTTMTRGGANGTYTFTNCTLGDDAFNSNQSFVVPDAGSLATYTFNDPIFAGTSGSWPFILRAGCKLTINGTSATQKVDLTPIFGINPQGLVQIEGGELVFNNVKSTVKSTVQMLNGFATLGGDLVIRMNGCEWLGGSGTIIVAGAGSAFSADVIARNTIWYNPSLALAPGNWISLQGTHTGLGTIQLDHCTLVGPMNDVNSQVIFTDSAQPNRDTLIANSSIFDDENAAAVTGLFGTTGGLTNLQGTGNVVTKRGSVGGGGFVSGEPAGFSSVETISGLALTATGRLLPASRAASKAVGSTETVDIDGEPRPQGLGADAGADEINDQIINAARNWQLLD